MDIKYEAMTTKAFDEAVESLKQALSARNFGVLWELNFKDKLREKNIQFDANFKILEVCNPRQAKEVLSRNIQIGYFLPCKMVVYEKNDSIYVGMMRPMELIGMLGMAEDEDFARTAQEVEEVLEAAINEAAK